jgi:hypothetical protein
MVGLKLKSNLVVIRVQLSNSYNSCPKFVAIGVIRVYDAGAISND